MVWEEVVEGGITRFVAVYHSTVPPEIGPVRSVRPMDAAIVAPLHGLLAFSGGQRPFVDAIAAAGLQVVSMDAGAAGFYRLDTRYAPHNVYADPNAFLAQADPAHLAPPAPQFARRDAGPAADRRGRRRARRPSCSLKLSRAQPARAGPGARRPAAGCAPRAPRPRPRPTGRRCAPPTSSSCGSRSSTPASPTRPATRCRRRRWSARGRRWSPAAAPRSPATWSKASPDAPVVLTDANGQPVLLAPGNTWVELVPNRTGAVTVG